MHVFNFLQTCDSNLVPETGTTSELSYKCQRTISPERSGEDIYHMHVLVKPHHYGAVWNLYYDISMSVATVFVSMSGESTSQTKNASLQGVYDACDIVSGKVLLESLSTHDIFW